MDKRKLRLLVIGVILIVFTVAYLSQTQKSSATLVNESSAGMLGDPAFYPSGYSLLGSTAYSSGGISDLQSDNGAYMVFNSYPSQTSGQTLYAHQETTLIAGTSYYLSKLTSADTTGTSRSNSVSTTGRKLFGTFVYALSGVLSIPASTWNIYYRTWLSGSGPTCHDDIDIIVRQSTGTVRTTIATDVGTSASLTTTQQTLSGTYSFSAYTVVNQTDYLEIDYYVHVTTSSSRTAYLRIDDNTLGTSSQTRASNIYLPSQYTTEIEFSGLSDTNAWNQLVWTVNSCWTTPSVSVTIQLYNYTLAAYPTSGDGYLAYVSSSTANTDETKTQTIATNPLQFRDSSGNWKLKIKAVQSSVAQFSFKADLIQLAYSDTASPSWSNVGTDKAIAGQPTLFYVKWSDNVGLSGFIFGSNNTGAWTNDTWTSMSGLTNWSNVTKTLNNAPSLLQWRVWANDTSNNWNDTGVLSIKILKPPTASFTYSPSTPYTSDTVTFNASSSVDIDGTIVSYYWTFGDGTNATGMVASHAYANNGVYTATLKVTDNDTLTDTTTKNVTVLDRVPVASFTRSLSSAPTGTAIYFNASASYDPDGSITSYNWSFGDGTNGTGVTASHSYSDNGTYTVTLTITDDDGSIGTATTTETISNRPPVAAFTASADNVFTNVTIYFNASASYDPDGTITSYYWSFGDGANATGMNVQHAYVENGSYVVTLTVTDNDLSTATANATRTILNRPPVAISTDSGGTVYTGQTITFNASASYDPDGSIVSYFWSFGDGANSTGVVASHAYVDNGTYTVMLTVTDNDGAQANSTSTKTILNRPPVTSFTASAATLNKGQILHLNASASYDTDGSIVSYFWSFGDGTNATGVTVDHSYTNAGIYTVRLNVTDNDGAVASTSTTITVVNQPPVASFTSSAATVYTGTIVSFNASGSYDPDGSIVSYFWTFGDGTNASGVTTTHSYADNATYVVTLKVTDNDGAAANATATVTVLNRPPIASFTQLPSTVFTGDVTTFNASASYDPDGSIVSYFWSFGDGSNASGLGVTHAYVEDGVYNVTLTVTDNDGSTASSTSTRTVMDRPPVASFTKSATSVYTGQVITFNASASYDPDGTIVSYFWTFGDGLNATGIVVSHGYADNGTYTVALTVTDNDGSKANSTSVVTILNRAPVASFTASATSVHKNDIIHFNASASYDPDGSIVSYFWSFGDGTNGTGILVDHSYTGAGAYVVALNLTDNDGATASAATTITVVNQPPVANFSSSATTVYTSDVVSFNGSSSYDQDGLIMSYFWTFGDGANASGVAVNHAFNDNGTYVVTLKVTDNDGATASATTTVTVLNRPPIASFTQSPSTVFTGDVTTFNASASYDPDGSISSYFWSFGDGSNASGLSVTHAYVEDGVYNVTLTVTDNDGSNASAVSTRTILNRPPVASFSASATPVYTGQTITFNASTSHDFDGTITSYFWSFGDGINASGITVSHAYADNGTYMVTLTVTDNDGSKANSTCVVTILNRPPVASFTASATNVHKNDIVHFNASASYDPDGTIVSYFWSFGDGSNATGARVDHSYANAGTYTVTLNVTDNDGATSSSSAAITVVNQLPVASFTSSAATVYTGTIVSFNASGSYDPDGVIVSYFWTFGDGTNATGLTTTHSYIDNGTYTVTLKVTDNDGAAANATATVTVLNRPPIASFTQLPSTVFTGDVTTFNASASYDPDGSIVSYSWAFGDGSNATGSIVTHAYAEDGVYNVTLSVTDNDGSTASSVSTRTVLDRSPVASFTVSATLVYTAQSISFNASASYDPDGTITSYFWSFGDGTNSAGVTVSHAYVDNGTYTVTLTVTDNDGSKANSTSVVTILNRAPVASFTASATSVHKNDIIHFNASASYDPDGSIISYFWTFGDGANATGVTFDHSYANAGTYTVRLNVTDNDGSTASGSTSITVEDQLPVANFTASSTSALTGVSVGFNASASYDPDGVIISYFWTFGDGTNATGVTATHSYVDNGTYTVTLKVTDNDGATATTTATITVLNRAPVASFTRSPQTVLTGDTANFNASASYDPDGVIISYFWTFGDGTNATGMAANHAYVENGVYTVILTATDNDGATGTINTTETVLNRPPVASFTTSTSTVLTYSYVNFNASSSYDPDGSIISYFWSFGDGSNATGTFVSHQYLNNGNYTVVLAVTDNDGATASTSAVETVFNRPPVASFTFAPDSPIVGGAVTFDGSGSQDQDGVVVSYTWDFGDGNITTTVSQNISYTYMMYGNYNVTLTVTDDDGATAATVKTLNVRAYPTADFTFTPSTPYMNQNVTLDASTSDPRGGTITSYFWIFGDGFQLNTTNPIVIHAYGTSGNYSVTLTVTDSEKLNGTISKGVSVLGAPQGPEASFTYTPLSPHTGDVVTFNASTSKPNSGNLTGYTWNFGDGNTTSTTNPLITHVYGNGGNYTVTLTVQNSEGLAGSTTKSITVLSVPPCAIFTISPAIQATARPVTFNASGSYDPDGSITNYTWTFGDGNITSSSTATITHAYSAAGNYTVTLQVTDNQGLNNSSSRTVQIALAPLAGFTYTPAAPFDHQLVTFDASGSYDPAGSIVNYSWDFGDGTTGNTTSSTTSHTYLLGGDYKVQLIVIDNKGLDGTNGTAIHVKGIPVAQFTWSPTSPIVGDVVTFDASPSSSNGGTITTYAWSFGDGTQLNMTSPLATHAYGGYGNYTVTLIVLDSEQLSSSVSKVTRIRDFPTASFVYAPSPITRLNPAVFDASASDPRGGVIANYTWNFGDGNVLVAVDPVVQHVFNTAGMFQVKLTVYDDENLSASLTRTAFVVKAIPIAIFTHTPDKPIVGQQTTFNGSDSYDPDGYVVTYRWDFGDGTIVSGVNFLVYHSFTAAGTYQATLTVIDNDGFNSSTSQTVEVEAYPSPNFSWSPYPYAIVLTQTVFDASASSAGSGTITSYVWNFCDGNISTTTSAVISHVFNASGNYNVVLTVTNSYNLSSSTTKTVGLYGTPIADFTWTPTVPLANATVTFDASASKPNGVIITSFSWNFGDGNTTSTSTLTITHFYSAAGGYTVSLTVTDNSGLSNSTSKTLNIASPQTPLVDFIFSPLLPGVNEQIVFNASGTVARGGSIIMYSWDFGNGTAITVVGPVIQQTYLSAGNFTVTLNATNTAGYWSVLSKTVQVIPVWGPTAIFSVSPGSPSFNQTATFDASGSALGWNGTTHPSIVFYTWSFGDGNASSTTDPVTHHVYLQKGNYTVTLTVTDADGGTGNIARTITIRGLMADLNGDGKVDMRDIAIVAKAFNTTPGNPAWNPIADLNGDGKVDMRDIAIVAKAFGQTA